MPGGDFAHVCDESEYVHEFCACSKTHFAWRSPSVVTV